jgi:AcrR family transcriptional regulator
MPQQPNPARRSAKARRAILRAAFELCGQVGYAQLTIEAIAERAGVGKQTIYRWWPSKGPLVLESLNDFVGEVTDFPDTGDIVADLRDQMAGVAGLLSSPEFAPIYTGLIGDGQSDPALATALLETIVMPRIDACRKRLEIAQRDGQLRSGVDLGVVVELLYGPLYHRLLLRTGATSAMQVDQVLDLAFGGLRPVQPASRGSAVAASALATQHG